MPILTSGQVTIVGSQDIGGLGPAESDPVQVDCEWLAGLPRLMPWVIVGLLLVWRGFINAHHWAVVVPLIVIRLVWSLAAQILPFDSISMTMMAQGIGDFSAALAVLWLAMGGLTRSRRWAAFLPSVLIMSIVAALAPLAESPATESILTISRLSCVIVAVVAACSSMMLAAWCSGKVVFSGRFIVWLLVWLALISVGGIVVIAAIIMLIEDHSLQWFWSQFDDVLLASLIISAVVCLVFLPFLVLAAQSPFHRRRLEAYLNPPRRLSIAVPAGSAGQALSLSSDRRDTGHPPAGTGS